jgi:hypothetical protein
MSESTPRLVMGAADGAGAGQESSLLGGGQNMTPGEVANDVSSPGPFQAASPTGSMHSWNGSGIKFEDDLASPMIYLQAQRDANFRVNNLWRTIVTNDRGTKVGTDDELEVGNQHDIHVQKNQTLVVGGNQTLTVYHNRIEEIDETTSLEVGDGGFTMEVDEDVGLLARKKIVIASETRIRLNVQGATIVVEPDHITIDCKDGVFFQMKQGGL